VPGARAHPTRSSQRCREFVCGRGLPLAQASRLALCAVLAVGPPAAGQPLSNQARRLARGQVPTAGSSGVGAAAGAPAPGAGLGQPLARLGLASALRLAHGSGALFLRGVEVPEASSGGQAALLQALRPLWAAAGQADTAVGADDGAAAPVPAAGSGADNSRPSQVRGAAGMPWGRLCLVGTHRRHTRPTSGPSPHGRSRRLTRTKAAPSC
jgi:hypothetical protein